MAQDLSTPTTPSRIASRHRTLANSLVQSTLRALSPTPLLGSTKIGSKDDQNVPSTPSRPPGIQRGLSLQLPKQDLTSPSASKLSNGITLLSPKLDPSISFGASSIPRRSRGLDFSRACTNLHHSTLAESSPDSSPIVGHRGMPIPRRSAGNFDSPLVAGSAWGTISSERMLGTSIGSNAMETSDSSESDDDMMREEDDTIHMTPQPTRSIWGLGATQSPGFDPMARTPTSKKFMNFTKRLRIKPKKRLPIAESPGNLSPPLTRNGESNGYLADMSRRESLSLGTDQLNLSDEIPQDALGLSQSGVIRRPVTRRSNMLPKPKGFARIRAALQEESSPLDIETKHEAAVIRHVRESDVAADTQSIAAPSTAPPSPSLVPTTSNEAIEELANIINKPRESISFGRHALRNSGGSEFWDGFNGHMRTPPPQFPKRANSTLSESEDISMESTASHPSLQQYSSHSPSRSSTPQPLEMRKTLGKRRREDDFDPAAMKRRAVSPGLSHQNSPVLPPSPAAGNGSWNGWQAKIHRESSASSSGTPVGMGKRASRVGMQGMNDTSDGMMNMSIE